MKNLPPLAPPELNGIVDNCVLCGRRLYVVGVFIPYPEKCVSYGVQPGSKIAYGLCKRCFKIYSEDVLNKKVEDRIQQLQSAGNN